MMLGEPMAGWTVGSRCAGYDYPDIKDGAPVVVKDGNGAIIAKSELVNSTAYARGGCLLSFEVEVPPADFVEVVVGQQSALTFSNVDLDERAWRLQLIRSGYAPSIVEGK